MAAPGQGVLVEFPGRLVLAQVGGEVSGGAKGGGVVLAQQVAAPGQSILIHFARRLGLAQRAQIDMAWVNPVPTCPA